MSRLQCWVNQNFYSGSRFGKNPGSLRKKLRLRPYKKFGSGLSEILALLSIKNVGHKWPVVLLPQISWCITASPTFPTVRFASFTGIIPGLSTSFGSEKQLNRKSSRIPSIFNTAPAHQPLLYRCYALGWCISRVSDEWDVAHADRVELFLAGIFWGTSVKDRK